VMDPRVKPGGDNYLMVPRAVKVNKGFKLPLAV
jgi:hypothetical protein